MIQTLYQNSSPDEKQYTLSEKNSTKPLMNS